MDVEVAVRDGVTVWTLTGRLDGGGALELDRHTATLAAETREVVLDLTGVRYLSSAGIRSLIVLEKALRARGGGARLAGLDPLVRGVLEATGLLGQFKVAASATAAVAAATGRLAATRDRRVETSPGGCFRVDLLAGGASFLDLWGSFPALAAGGAEPPAIAAVTIDELGLALGVGALGLDAAAEAGATGEMLATPVAVGVRPADTLCVSDFLLAAAAPEARVFPAAAVGLSGDPLLCASRLGGGDVALGALVSELLELAGEAGGGAPPVLGLVVLAGAGGAVTSHYRTVAALASGELSEAAPTSRAEGVLVLGVAVDGEALRRAGAELPADLPARIGASPLGPGLHLHAHAITLAERPEPGGFDTVAEALQRVMRADNLLEVGHLGPEARLESPLAWVFAPMAARAGSERLVAVEVAGAAPLRPEWEAITRRLFADASRVVLRPIHGGYSAATFAAECWDRDGRRMLPTVVKLSSREVTARERQAHARHVQGYILNNSTVIMGSSSCGAWAGLRYSFVGITGRESRIGWLEEHYRRRPAEELVPLFRTIFTDILKPWYGQPRWESIRPWADHDPRRLFPSLVEDAATVLGIDPEAPTIDCPALGRRLPNPYRFLIHEFARRRSRSYPWYTSVVHGDLNLKNILLDERENVYVIDFSETRVGNVVADFARLECVLKLDEMPSGSDEDLAAFLAFEGGLLEPDSLAETPPLRYAGSHPEVLKAYRMIRLVRSLADRATVFEESLVPYLLAMLEWTYPVVSWGSASSAQKWHSAYSAALVCEKLLRLDP